MVICKDIQACISHLMWTATGKRGDFKEVRILVGDVLVHKYSCVTL